MPISTRFIAGLAALLWFVAPSAIYAGPAVLASPRIALRESSSTSRPPSRLEIGHLLMHRDLVRLERTLCALQERYEQAPSRATEDAVVRGFLAFAGTQIGFEKRLAQWRSALPRSYAARIASGTHQMRLASLVHEQRMSRDSKHESAKAARHVARARAHFEAALAINQRSSRAWSQLIEIAAQNGERDTRDAVAARALTVLPRSLEIRIAYALALQPARGGSMRAVEAFIEASRAALTAEELALLSANADVVVADESLRAGHYPEAIASYDRAAAAGDQWRSLYGRAVGRRHMGRQEQALADVSRALELRPQAPNLLLERSHVYRALGKPKDALRDLNVALAFDPRDCELRNARAWLLLAHLHDAGEALEDAHKLVRACSDRSDAWQTYGSVLLWGKKDGRAAGTAFERSIAIEGRNTDAWFGYGQALYTQGDGDSLDAFDTYASLCAQGAKCDADDQAWLKRFVHDPYTYAQWPRIFFKWRLLARLL
jgi:tetratricopeptide (TPR) repeat protein